MKFKPVHANKKRLYIADDSAAMCDVLQRYLEMEGYSVETTVSAKKLARITHPLPDVILLDLSFPNYEGSEVCRTLKANPLTKMIPVIIMSGNNDIREIAAVCGADDCLVKPFSTEDLLLIIESNTAELHTTGVVS